MSLLSLRPVQCWRRWAEVTAPLLLPSGVSQARRPAPLRVRSHAYRTHTESAAARGVPIAWRRGAGVGVGDHLARHAGCWPGPAGPAAISRGYTGGSVACGSGAASGIKRPESSLCLSGEGNDVPMESFVNAALFRPRDVVHFTLHTCDKHFYAVLITSIKILPHMSKFKRFFNLFFHSHHMYKQQTSSALSVTLLPIGDEQTAASPSVVPFSADITVPAVMRAQSSVRLGLVNLPVGRGGQRREMTACRPRTPHRRTHKPISGRPGRSDGMIPAGQWNGATAACASPETTWQPF